MRTLRRKPLIAGLVSAALTVTVGLVGMAPAYATSYPSWQDLQNAKANTAAAQAAVTNIQSLIANLKTQVAAAQQVANQKQAEYNTAKQKLDDATQQAADLQAQAASSKQDADAAAKSAATVVAQMARNSGSDMTINLLLNSDASNAEQLLSKLGNLNQVVQRASDVYTKAIAAQKQAQSLSDQAAKAQEARAGLEAAANQALADSQAAAANLQSTLDAQQDKSVELDAQLAYMQDQQNNTAAEYEAGVEAAKALALQYGGGNLPGGWKSDQGWANPAQGELSDGFGPRTPICTAGGCSGSYHYGQDIAARCDQPIYAASDGIVVAAGYYGTWGNRIKIDHGGGIYTLYAHIRNGGIEVNVGDYVSAGQEIARVGMTGAATGCHLHFEVYDGVNNRIDPVPFMASHGVSLG